MLYHDSSAGISVLLHLLPYKMCTTVKEYPGPKAAAKAPTKETSLTETPNSSAAEALAPEDSNLLKASCTMSSTYM